MTVLLDTCTFFWMASAPNRLSGRAQGIVEDPAVYLYLSAISVWELAQKEALGKLAMHKSADQAIPETRSLFDIRTIDFSHEDALRTSQIGLLHRDPFDRMLVCQALEHGLTILTPDPLIRQYPVETVW